MTHWRLGMIACPPVPTLSSPGTSPSDLLRAVGHMQGPALQLPLQPMRLTWGHLRKWVPVLSIVRI